MILAEVSVAFSSFLSLLFSSSPISELTRDPLYLLGLVLIRSFSNTEKSEIKAVVPRQVTLYKQASTEPQLYWAATHKLCKSSLNLNPAQHQGWQCDTVKCKSKQIRLQFSVNTNFWDCNSQHQYSTVMHVSNRLQANSRQADWANPMAASAWVTMQCPSNCPNKASVRFSMASRSTFQPQMEETYLL